MAIQMRRGEYDDFDASKMLAGELAVVVSGDPETEGGALYVATAAGSATRVAFANEIPGDATTTSDGLMSASDKAKLDGITIEGRSTPTAGYQRVKVGDGYADVALMDPNTGLINANNIPMQALTNAEIDAITQ